MKPATASEDKSVATQFEPFRFEFTRLTASTVCVAGTFHGRHAEAKPLHPVGDGHWLKEAVLPPSTCAYRLAVDGLAIAYPLANETPANPYGRGNSILKVTDSPEAAHFADAEKLPLKITNNQKTQTV